MKVVFLDRDGVINVFPGEGKYVTSPKEFSFIPGSCKAIADLKKAGFKVCVISNQAGVAKGLYSEDDLQKINKKMTTAIKSRGGSLDGIFYCIHHPQDNCSCRKPKTGLIDKALNQLQAKIEISFFIGDSFRDMQLAKTISAMAILVLSGQEKKENIANWPFRPDLIFDNLAQAAKYIIENYG